MHPELIEIDPLLSELCPPAKPRAGWRGIAAFALATALIWSGYFTFRPPAPMLGMRHLEHMPAATRAIALTFDDAPHPLTTPLLLEALRRSGIKATFFVVAENMRRYPELAHRIVAEKQSMGNHSRYHYIESSVPHGEYERDIEACFDAIAGVTGIRSHLYRPPGGEIDRELMRYLYQHHETLAWWSNNLGDWTRPSASRIAARAEASIRPGDILLMHDAGPGTAQSIARLAHAARLRGLHFRPMPDDP